MKHNVSCKSTPTHSELLQIFSEFAVNQPLPGSTLCVDPLWVGCRSYLSLLLISSHPPRTWILSELAVDQSPRSTHGGSSLSWLWILSELAVNWPPRINTLWILSELAADPIWVGCQLTPQDQHTVDPLWVGCGSYLRWLSANPPRINTLQILSELAVDPLWVGCQFTPLSSLPTYNLPELAVDQSPSLPSTPLPSLPTCQLTELVVAINPPPPTEFKFLIFNIMIIVTINGFTKQSN